MQKSRKACCKGIITVIRSFSIVGVLFIVFLPYIKTTQAKSDRGSGLPKICRQRQLPTNPYSASVSSKGQFTQSSGNCAAVSPTLNCFLVLPSFPPIYQLNGFTYRVTEISEHAWRLLQRNFTTFRGQLQMLMISSSPSKKSSSKVSRLTMDYSSRKRFPLSHQIGRLTGPI